MGKCLRQLESEGMECHEPIPFTDAADTSSFTLSRQRENIAGVEVGRWLQNSSLVFPNTLLKIEN